jgi:hypothetical protein
MRFAHMIQSRKARAWAVLIALAITLILIVFLLYARSPKSLEMDDLYGLLD